MTSAPPRRWSFSLRTLFVVVALLALLCALLSWAWFHFATSVYVTSQYNIETTFETMPKDDEGLESWLQDQSGIMAGTVSVDRPSGTKLIVHFVMARNRTGHPGLPDLEEKCKALGYAGGSGAFLDPIRGTVFRK